MARVGRYFSKPAARLSRCALTCPSCIFSAQFLVPKVVSSGGGEGRLLQNYCRVCGALDSTRATGSTCVFALVGQPCLHQHTPKFGGPSLMASIASLWRDRRREGIASEWIVWIRRVVGQARIGSGENGRVGEFGAWAWLYFKGRAVA